MLSLAPGFRVPAHYRSQPLKLGRNQNSARASLKNIGGIAGLIGVNLLVLALAGELVFCVGLCLVIPLLTATSLVAYRKVFPKLPTT